MSTLLLRLKKINPLTVKSIHLPSVSMPWNAMLWAGVLGVSFFIGLYVIQINQLTGKYYTIATAQVVMQDLLEENHTLNIAFVENSYLITIIEKAKMLEFQKVDVVDYIHIPDHSFAKAALRGK